MITLLHNIYYMDERSLFIPPSPFHFPACSAKPASQPVCMLATLKCIASHVWIIVCAKSSPLKQIILIPYTCTVYVCLCGHDQWSVMSLIGSCRFAFIPSLVATYRAPPFFSSLPHSQSIALFLAHTQQNNQFLYRVKCLQISSAVCMRANVLYH